MAQRVSMARPSGRERVPPRLLEHLERRLLLSGQGSSGELVASGAVAVAANQAAPVLMLPGLSSALPTRRAAMNALPASATWDVPLPNGIYDLQFVGLAAPGTLGSTLTAATTGQAFSWQATVAVTTGHLAITNQSALTVAVSSMSILPDARAAFAQTSVRLLLASAPITTPSADTQGPALNPAPTAPAPLTGGLAVTVANAHELDLSWTAQPGAAGYSIERSIDGQNYAIVATTPNDTTTYQNTGLSPGTTYWYRVRTVAADQTLSAQSLSATAQTRAFVAYNLLTMKNMPNMSTLGFTPAYLGDGGRVPVLVGTTWTKVPNEAATRQMARNAAAVSDVIILDIEDWPTDIRTSSQADVNATIDKFSQMIDWIRNEEPGLKIGIYGVMPIRDYWTPVHYQDLVNIADGAWAQTHPVEYQQGLAAARQKMDAWDAANAVLKPLAGKVDVIFASLYTFYDDPQNWQAYAAANLAEAARFGKPVMAFLWNEYHISNQQLAGQDLPAADFRAELEYVYQHTDGVALWNSEPTIAWNPTSGWEQQAVEFLNAHQIKPAR